MTISLDQINAVINVEIADLTFVSAGIYNLDTDVFRQTLRSLEDEVENDVYPITHNHTQPITVGGVALARVIEISPHWEVTFEDGAYRVILVGSNNNILDVATVNNVSIASTNSTGLTYSKEVEDQAFTDARVWIDVDGGGPGVVYPTGTPGVPSDNLTDSQSIIAARVRPLRLHLRGALVLTGGDSIDAYDITGPSAELASITFGGASTMSTHITYCSLSGAASGDLSAGFCDVTTVTGFSGVLHNCGIESVTLTAGDTANKYQFIDCHSLIEGNTKALIDVNSVADPQIQVRKYSGGLEVRNFDTANGVMSIDGQGRLLLDSTCTDGEIVVGGDWAVTDNSGAGCNVIDNTTASSIWSYTGP